MSKIAKKIRPESFVACLTTNSLLEILKIYVNDPYQITEITAFASVSLEDLPHYKNEDLGLIIYKERKVNSFRLNYKIQYDHKGDPTNPITIATVKLIEDKLNDLGLEDASTESFKVIIKDKGLGDIAKVDQEEFQMELYSDPVDSDLDREKVREHPVNTALIKHNRFQYRIMHVKKLIDLKQLLTKKKTKLEYIIIWIGKTIFSIKSPVKVVQYLAKHHLGSYELIKKYGTDEKDVLILLSVSR